MGVRVCSTAHTMEAQLMILVTSSRRRLHAFLDRNLSLRIIAVVGAGSAPRSAAAQQGAMAGVPVASSTAFTAACRLPGR